MAYVQREDQVRGDGQPASRRPRRRTRHQGRRARTVRFALTDAEYAEVSAAAHRAGLARGAYAAEAALAVARGEIAAPDAPLRDAFHVLDRAALLVRRIGVNLNQAVAKLNATGQWSGDLPRYAEESVRRAARLEAAGEDLRKRFLRTIRAPPVIPSTRAGGRTTIPPAIRRSRMTGPSSATARPARMAFRPAFPASGTGRDGVPRGPGHGGWRSAARAEEVPVSPFPPRRPETGQR